MESVSILTLDFLLSLYMLLPSIEGRSYVIFSSISYLPCNQKCGFWDWQWLLLLSAVVLLLCIRPAVGKFSIGTAQTLAPPFSTCHCLLHFGEADESHSCLSSIRFQLYTVPGSDSSFSFPLARGILQATSQTTVSEHLHRVFSVGYTMQGGICPWSHLAVASVEMLF